MGDPANIGGRLPSRFQRASSDQRRRASCHRCPIRVEKKIGFTGSSSLQRKNVVVAFGKRGVACRRQTGFRPWRLMPLVLSARPPFCVP